MTLNHHQIGKRRDRVSSGNWRLLAACRGLDPELFHPERGQSTEDAKAVCWEECPVQVECLEYAIDAGEILGVQTPGRGPLPPLRPQHAQRGGVVNACALAPGCTEQAVPDSELCAGHLAILDRPVPTTLEKAAPPARFVVVAHERLRRATLHRTHCPKLRLWDGTTRPLLAGTCPRLCAVCRPTEEEVRQAPPIVEWLERAVPVPPAQRVPIRVAEDEHGRSELGLSRRRAS